MELLRHDRRYIQEATIKLAEFTASFQKQSGLNNSPFMTLFHITRLLPDASRCIWIWCCEDFDLYTGMWIWCNAIVQYWKNILAYFWGDFSQSWRGFFFFMQLCTLGGIIRKRGHSKRALLMTGVCTHIMFLFIMFSFHIYLQNSIVLLTFSSSIYLPEITLEIPLSIPCVSII